MGGHIRPAGKRGDMATNGGLPNILLIIADQMTPFMLEACGHRGARTRHISALANRAVNFTNAYTPSPICVPRPVLPDDRASDLDHGLLRQRRSLPQFHPPPSRIT